MKKFLCLLTMLLSLQTFAVTMELKVQDNDSVSVELEKGDSYKIEEKFATLKK